MHRTLLRLLAGLLLCAPVAALAQSASATPDQTDGHLILVLPFDNRSGQSNLGWIADSFPDTLNQRLNSSGFLTITRDDRQYALDHLGLPPDFHPTRATTIRIAQTLDADYVIVGSFTLKENRIAVQAQVLQVKQLSMSPPLEDSAELNRLLNVEDAIAWKIARQIDPHFKIALQTFLSASTGVKLSSFENYIRGIDETSPAERIKHLQLAVQETPTYSSALLALGKLQYAQRDYEHAAATLAKVPKTSRHALEAGFYLGLARFNSAKYADAESAFAFVASRMPLPEVVNNQGVAASRQGKDATALFQRASTADPNDGEYHYNLAIAMFRRGDNAGGQRELKQALTLRPKDPEALALKDFIAAGHTFTPGPVTAPPATAPVNPGTAPAKPSTSGAETEQIEPVPRIRRSFSETSFRQAAFELDQMRALRMASLPPAERAAQYVQLGQDYLAQGFLPEAEQEYQAALSAEPGDATAHAGLARIREQSGDPTAARTEAQSSLKLKPNVEAYLVLARLELNDGQLSPSAADVRNALHLEPKNTAALGLSQALKARGQALP